MTDTVKDEIQRAIDHLGLKESDIRLLADSEGRSVYSAAFSHFVVSGDRLWWWEDFRFPCTRVHFEDQLGFQRIERIVPALDEVVWFIAEDDSLAYPVYEATPRAIQAVIGDCYGFEYYMIAKDFTWLICETHHDLLIGIGSAVEERLQQEQRYPGCVLM
jgi:hypothetical protein